MIYQVIFSLLISAVAILNVVWAQQPSHLLFSLSQLSGKTYCFDNDAAIGANDPRQLSIQSDRDSIRVAIGSSGMAEAVSGRCDYLVGYSVLSDQFQEIVMQPIGLGFGPAWGAYPYGPGGYPGWGAAGGTTWVPVVVTRQRYRLVLDLFSYQQRAIQVYQGSASILNTGQDPRMIIPNLASKIMQRFPMNNLLQ